MKKIQFLALLALVCFGCEPNTGIKPNTIIGNWNSSFQYEQHHWPGEYITAYEHVEFTANKRMIYESWWDWSEFPDIAIYDFLVSHKEFTYVKTDTTLTFSYLPEKSYRDNLSVGGKELMPLITTPFEWTTQYTIVNDTTLVLWQFSHNGKDVKTLELTRSILKDID